MSYRFTFELTLKLGEEDSFRLSSDDYTIISPPGEECSICLEHTGDDWVRLACDHAFHLRCIQRVISKKCPLCRKPIQSESSECVIL